MNWLDQRLDLIDPLVDRSQSHKNGRRSHSSVHRCHAGFDYTRYSIRLPALNHPNLLYFSEWHTHRSHHACVLREPFKTAVFLNVPAMPSMM